MEGAELGEKEREKVSREERGPEERGKEEKGGKEDLVEWGSEEMGGEGEEEKVPIIKSFFLKHSFYR